MCWISVQSPSCIQLFRDPIKMQPSRLLCPWDFPGQNTRMCCHFLLQGSNLRLLHWQADSITEPPGKPIYGCRQILTGVTFRKSKFYLKDYQKTKILRNFFLKHLEHIKMFIDLNICYRKVNQCIHNYPVLGIPWQFSGQDSGLSLLKAQIESLVGEPRSHKPHRTAKSKEIITQSLATLSPHVLRLEVSSPEFLVLKSTLLDFLGGLVAKNLPANTGDTGSIPGLGRLHMLWTTHPMQQNY